MSFNDIMVDNWGNMRYSSAKGRIAFDTACTERKGALMKRAKKKGILTKKKTNSAKSANKTKKYAAIFSISLLVIVISSAVILGLGGFFNKSEIDGEVIAPVDKVSGKTNFLILGVDNEGLRTDTIIVASYDANEGTVDMLSIPRDTRMYVGSRFQKINAAHAISQSNGKIRGPEGSIEAVTRLTGIPINYYVEFSFKAFRETIDALGGIQYDVPQRMKYSDPTQGLYIDLYPGDQLLDGDKAEQLVRFRKYPEGDIKRVRVQQDFIKAVIDQKLNIEIVTKIPELYKTLSENVKTNMSLGDIIKYANSLKDIDKEKITMHELPGEYSGAGYDASYWLPNMKEIKLLVQNTFKYDTSDTTSGKPISGAEYGKYTTEVLNPEDIVLSEQDKATRNNKSTDEAKEKTDSADKGTSKDKTEDTKKDNKEKSDNTSKKTDTNETASSSDKNNTKTDDTPVEKETDENTTTGSVTTPKEETKTDPEPTPKPQEPAVKPLDGMDSSDEFKRPGAN